MNCPNCGATLEKDARFCVVCGNPVPEETQTQTNGGYTPGGSGAYTSGGASSYTPGGSSSYHPGGSGAYTAGGSSSYTPGGSGSYAPGGAGAYTPGGNGNYGAPGGYTSGTNTDHIREYFFGRKYRWPYLVILAGIILSCVNQDFIKTIGNILVVVGVIAIPVVFIWSRFVGFPHEDEVDAAWEKQKSVMHDRGLEKLNLVQEQLGLIDPLVLIGFGQSPHSSFNVAREGSKRLKKGFGVFTSLRNAIFGKRKDGTEYDPVYSLKIGSNGRIRSLLQEVTVYAFTENQVLMYSGDVDISTGLVYNEYTAECFYEDIEGIRLSENVYKILNAKKRRYENRLTNQFILYLGGCNFQCSVNNEVDSSVGEGQFAAMRSLIREKKNG